MFFNDVAYAMGSMGQAGGDSAFGSPASMNILLMVAIFAIFYFLIIRPQQKEAKRTKAMLSSLKKGDRVLTVGGIYGVILEVKKESLILDLGDSTVELGLRYVSALVEGRASSSVKSDRKRRPAAKRSASKAENKNDDQETEFATEMVESEPENAPEEDNEEAGEDKK